MLIAILSQEIEREREKERKRGMDVGGRNEKEWYVCRDGDRDAYRDRDVNKWKERGRDTGVLWIYA